MKKHLTGFMLGIAVMGLLAMNTSTQDKDYSLGRVERKSGKFIFLNCEPINNYDVAFLVEIKFVWSESQINTMDKMTNTILNKAFKISEKENKEFDALIINSGQNKDLAIKFK